MKTRNLKSLKERASICRFCDQFQGYSTEEELLKLERLEQEKGEIFFICESCNELFIKWHLRRFGKTPELACILGGPTLH